MVWPTFLGLGGLLQALLCYGMAEARLSQAQLQLVVMFFWLFYLPKLNSKSETTSCYRCARVMLQSSQLLSTAAMSLNTVYEISSIMATSPATLPERQWPEFSLSQTRNKLQFFIPVTAS